MQQLHHQETFEGYPTQIARNHQPIAASISM
jgi:hypothetical protein